MTVTAKTIGTPTGGLGDQPWTYGHPAKGERVAIFAYDVASADGTGKVVRTYHVAPEEAAKEGQLTEPYREPQGLTVQWFGCGTGTVVRPTQWAEGDVELTCDPDTADEMVNCEVEPDNPRII